MSKVTVSQVSLEEVLKNPLDSKLFRICVCDDGNYGKQHITARLKPVKNVVVGELIPEDAYAYIRIEVSDEQ